MKYPGVWIWTRDTSLELMCLPEVVQNNPPEMAGVGDVEDDLTTEDKYCRRTNSIADVFIQTRGDALWKNNASTGISETATGRKALSSRLWGQ